MNTVEVTIELHHKHLQPRKNKFLTDSDKSDNVMLERTELFTHYATNPTVCFPVVNVLVSFNQNRFAGVSLLDLIKN